MLSQVARARMGMPIFTAPSMEYVPLIYTPFYYYVAAAVSTVTGLSFFPLRIVSFLASLGLFVLMYKLARCESGDRRTGVIAVSLFAATFVIGGSWLDIGRNDSLFLFMAIAGVYALRRSDTLKSAVVAGLCFAVAAMTKQSALVIAAPLGLHLLLANWRRGLAFGVPLALVFFGLAGIFDWVSDGWFGYYTIEIPRGHALVPERFLGFWTDDMLGKFPIATVGGLGYLAYRTVPRARRSGFLGALGAGLLAAAWSSRMHSGGIENVLIPGYFALSLCFALGLGEGMVGGGESRFAPYRPLALCTAAGLQFLLLVYNPTAQVPNSADREAGQALVRELATIDGPVWVPGQPYLAEVAGKPAYAHAVALQDILRAGESPTKTALARDLVGSITERRFTALLLDGSFQDECPPRATVIDDVNWICPEIQAAYRRERLLVLDPAAFEPVAGSPRRPVILYRALAGGRP